ncbi:hypothetical protein [Rubrivirga sp. IMCC45206]|uniref:hypothetical protein n=1 Tax=Rubrivirga sp. IMCC45206 TaxID=3391614 RepID=UPI00398FFB3B
MKKRRYDEADLEEPDDLEEVGESEASAEPGAKRQAQEAGGKPAKETNEAHAAIESLPDLHKNEAQIGDGACLTRCKAAYKPNNTCSYRWQASYRAIEHDHEIYNAHPSEARRLGALGWSTYATSTIEANRAAITSGFVVETKTRRTEADDGTVTEKKYQGAAVSSHSFMTGFAPYPNQAHHLLPNAVLQGALNERLKSDLGVLRVAVQTLLGERYNLNHWKNMMALPCERDPHGLAVGLPIHPAGHNHMTYSARVQALVGDELAPYEGVLAARQRDGHAVPEGRNVKDGLVGISDGIHATIVANIPALQDEMSERTTMDDFHDLLAAGPAV